MVRLRTFVILFLFCTLIGECTANSFVLLLYHTIEGSIYIYLGSNKRF
jgi:hypothetical protein